jgi:hypothetical protein
MFDWVRSTACRRNWPKFIFRREVRRDRELNLRRFRGVLVMIEMAVERRALPREAAIKSSLVGSLRKRVRGPLQRRKAPVSQKAFERLDELVDLAAQDSLIEPSQKQPGLARRGTG